MAGMADMSKHRIRTLCVGAAAVLFTVLMAFFGTADEPNSVSRAITLKNRLRIALGTECALGLFFVCGLLNGTGATMRLIFALCAIRLFWDCRRHIKMLASMPVDSN
jgi:hypothetical protein